MWPPTQEVCRQMRAYAVLHITRSQQEQTTLPFEFLFCRCHQVMPKKEAARQQTGIWAILTRITY